MDKRASKLYLWTERGANRHCKILDTDKAWEQFDNLEESYFRVKQARLNSSAVCDVEHLKNVTYHIRALERIMLRQGDSPQAIARMALDVCDTYNAPVPHPLVKELPTPTQIALHEIIAQKKSNPTP